MPALVTATVVRWEVDWDQTPPVTCLRDSRQVSLVVPDGANTADLSPLLGQYIVDTADPAEPGASYKRLVQAMRDGLPQAYAPQRTQFTAPPAPLRKSPLA